MSVAGSKFVGAVAWLEISANICEINAPLFEENGLVIEADNCRKNAANYREAVLALKELAEQQAKV